MHRARCFADAVWILQGIVWSDRIGVKLNSWGEAVSSLIVAPFPLRRLALEADKSTSLVASLVGRH